MLIIIILLLIIYSAMNNEFSISSAECMAYCIYEYEYKHERQKYMDRWIRIWIQIKMQVLSDDWNQDIFDKTPLMSFIQIWCSLDFSISPYRTNCYRRINFLEPLQIPCIYIICSYIYTTKPYTHIVFLFYYTYAEYELYPLALVCLLLC